MMSPSPKRAGRASEQISTVLSKYLTRWEDFHIIQSQGPPQLAKYCVIRSIIILIFKILKILTTFSRRRIGDSKRPRSVSVAEMAALQVWKSFDIVESKEWPQLVQRLCPPQLQPQIWSRSPPLPSTMLLLRHNTQVMWEVSLFSFIFRGRF